MKRKRKITRKDKLKDRDIKRKREAQKLNRELKRVGV